MKQNTKLFYTTIFCLLMISLLVTGCKASETQTATNIFKNITLQEAANLVEENIDNLDFVILDVRTPSEFAEGHIKGANNIDYYSETFQEELNKLDKNKTYFVYCRSGNRSGQTIGIMKTLGFSKIYNLSAAGMGDWIAAGLPYETAAGTE